MRTITEFVRFIALGFYLTIWVFLTRGEANTCDSTLNIGTRLNINSIKNDSGHWVSQVELVHDADSRDKSWFLNVFEHTSKCKDNGSNKDNSNGFVAISGTLISPQLNRKNHSHVYFGYQIDLESLNLQISITKAHLPWREAKRVCEERFQQMAVATREMFHSLVKLLHMAHIKKAFLGLHRDAGKDQEFLTISGEPFKIQNITQNGSPERKDQANQETCGVVTDYGGLIVGVPCKQALPFICQKPL